MEAYIGPVVFCVGISIFFWLRGLEERVVPYRESLVSKDFYPLVEPSEKYIVWILRSYTVGSRLFRMIQYMNTHYGIPQVVIIPNESKISLGSNVPILEFFQKTEIAVALQRASHVFCEAGVIKTAAITATAAQRPLKIFIHATGAKKELQSIEKNHAEIFYTSASIQEEFSEFSFPSFQFYLPVFVKEHVTHTTREKIVCLCKRGRWKFQEIARTLPAYTFLYNGTPNFKEAGILCIVDRETPYEVGIQAAASGIPIVCLWSTEFEEIYKSYAIFIRDNEWKNVIQRLKEDLLFYHEWSKKAIKLSQIYDSSKEMDMFLNFVFSGKLTSHH